MGTKDDLLEALQNSGYIRKYTKHPVWVDVFQAYQEATGKQLGYNCESCYKTALRWLRGK
jgi:hypothetical protein